MGAHYERACLLFRQTRYAQAERELHEELAEQPQSGWAHALLGRCLAMQQRMEEAVAEGEEAVRVAPHLPYAFRMLGHTYGECGRLKDAEAALREALRLNPRSTSSLQALAWAQFQCGDRLGALATVEEGLAIDPQHVGCLNYRGMFKRVLGNWKEAEQTLRESLRNDPESDHAHANLAYALFWKAHAHLRANRHSWGPQGEAALRESLQHSLEALRLNPCSEFAKGAALTVLLARPRMVAYWLGFLMGMLALLILFCAAASGSLRVKPNGDAENLDIVATTVPTLLGFLTLAFSNGLYYLLMRWHRLGNAVLLPGQRRAARTTTVCLGAGAVALVVAAFTWPLAIPAVLFLSLAAVSPLAFACEASPGWSRKIMTSYAILLVVVELACLAVAWGGGRAAWDQAMIAVAFWGALASLLSAGVWRVLQRRFVRRKG